MFKRLCRAPVLKRLLRLGIGLMTLWLVLVLALGVIIHAYGWVDRAQHADVIIVLGAGLRRDGRPGPALTRRSIHAAALWQQRYASHIICSGGRPDQLTPRSEAEVCAEILREHGVPADAIVLEERSRSTEENAIESKQVMAANGWKTALLVSDTFHMLRANWIFNLYGLDVSLSPVTETRPAPFDYVVAISREILALHWQVFKEVFHLPITYVKSF